MLRKGEKRKKEVRAKRWLCVPSSTSQIFTHVFWKEKMCGIAFPLSQIYAPPFRCLILLNKIIGISSFLLLMSCCYLSNIFFLALEVQGMTVKM